MNINIGTTSAKYKQHIPTPRILYKMYLNPGPITKSKSCPKNWCTQPKDAGLEIISLQSQGPTANMLLNPLTKGCTKQTVYTGGRRLVRGYVCKIMSIIYIKLLCTYLHWHTNQSISISPLQLTKAVIFSKRPSLGKGRQAAHSSDKTYWEWQVCQ